MKRLSIVVVLGCVLLLLGATEISAQGASEAYGTVTGRDGTPVENVVVTFRPQGNPAMAYSGKTNKKGKYYVSGLFTPKEDDMWDIVVEIEGWIPTLMVVESRTVNRVLVGDIMEAKLPYGAKIPEIPIRPLGKARVDLTLTPANEVLAQVQQAQQEAATDGGAGASEEAAAPQAQDPWAEALTLAQGGDLEGSVAAFEKAIAAEPDDAERPAAFAKVLFGLERYEDAEVAARRAIELDPQRVDVRKVLASSQVERGDLAGASATLAEAIAIAPQDTGLHERQAFVATAAGDEAGAIAAYERIVTIDPVDVDAWLALGALYARSGDAAKSEQAYQKVTELNPQDAYQTFYNLGVLIMNREDRNEADTSRAIAAFRKAVEIKPDYAQAHQQLAFALLGTGDNAGALAALESYVRAAPKASDAGRMQSLIDTLKKSK